MELSFILLDILGIIISLAYYRRGIRSSALLTLLLAALTLVPIRLIRGFGAVCVILITLCFFLFQTKIGAKLLSLFGLDAYGRRPGSYKPEDKPEEKKAEEPAEEKPEAEENGETEADHDTSGDETEAAPAESNDGETV